MTRLIMARFPRILLACLLAMAALPGQGRADGNQSRPAAASPAAGQARAALARYGRAVDRVLFDQFGLGSRSRNVYCYGPAIIRYQIMPDGSVRDVRLLRQSLPSLNAFLVARLSNTRFPKFYPGMPDRPYTKTYSYGVTRLAAFHFNAENVSCP